MDNSKLHQLQKTVFRVSRGNIWTLYVNLKDSKYSSSDKEAGRERIWVTSSFQQCRENWVSVYVLGTQKWFFEQETGHFGE